MSNELIDTKLAKRVEAELESRVQHLLSRKKELELKVGDALLASRNMLHENPGPALVQMRLSASFLAEKRKVEVEISSAEMQAAYFRAGAPLRVCDLLASKYVPPWVVWHTPEHVVYDIVRECNSFLGGREDLDIYARVAVAHDIFLTRVHVVDMKQHKPPATITQAERKQMQLLKEKLRRSHAKMRN